MLSLLSVNASCKALLNTNIVLRKVATCKFSHVAHHLKSLSVRKNTSFNFQRHSTAFGVLSVRHQSTTDGTLKKLSTEEIPEPPTPVIQETIENITKFHPNGEVAFESIGLGGHSPVGLIQSCLEWCHISLDLPWWGTIALGTLCVRLAIFPFVIITQRNVVKMHNNMPAVQEIQVKISEARQCGNQYEAALYAHELSKLWKEKKISPFKNFMVVAVQTPIFISFFLALRKMAAVPVDSFKTGGLFTFTDLTIPDPYYALPIATCTTLFMTILLSTEVGGAQLPGVMKYVFRAVPLIMFPFIMNFPGAILCYWLSTNIFSLLQVGFLRIPVIRKTFNIPERIKHNPSQLPMEKGFTAGLKDCKEHWIETWTNVKIARQLADRDHADAMQFNKAAKGPIIKTYKYDPTKQVRNAQTATAAKR